ncbi:unnamed protein product [Effrenium voratum]|uniref:Uncharacterized protein n=1 Tax=Effrenium voratum TaxID=2562239 RepID=A0AA36IFS7_9DINO|nr:unnamed protein product [Effrenium voratum]
MTDGTTVDDFERKYVTMKEGGKILALWLEISADPEDYESLAKEAIEELRHPKVVALVHSLLGIPSMFKRQAPDVAQGMIQRIIKQNVGAKKLPVSGKSRSKPDLGVTEAIAMYNACPEERSGTGSLVIDGKKVWAIKHWMEKCSAEAKEVVKDSLQDYPFHLGPFGEQFAMVGQVFLGSCAEDLSACPQGKLVPLANEASIPVNWELALDCTAQTMLFSRVKIAFSKATGIVEDVREKKRNRMKADELALRNILAFWSQVRMFCSSRLPGFEEFDSKLKMGNTVDDQFQIIMDERPNSFAISMLPVAQAAAASEVRAQEESATMEVDKQRVELRAARWKFFQAALERDQKKKEMSWRMEQARLGERVVSAYTSKFLRTVLVKQMEHMHEHVHEFRNYVAPRAALARFRRAFLVGLLVGCGDITLTNFSRQADAAGVKTSDIYVVCYVDLNVPLTNSKEKMNELMTAVQFINDISPTRHIAVVEFPEQAKKSSKRGLADEEKEVQETLWSLRQHCDTRWVLPFDVQPSAENHRRPLGDLSKELLLPESLNPNEDLRTADRQRPSPETVAAQKGTDRFMAVIPSILKLPAGQLGNHPVFEHRLKKTMCGTWCADNLYYLSVSWLSNDTFGQTRLLREVTNAWLQRRFGYSGQKFSDQPPSLTAEEISSIPGAEASLGNLDSMRFEVLGRIADQMQIKQDEHKFWAAQGGEISETYNAWREQHAQLLSKLGAQGSEARGSGIHLKSKDETPSEVAGVELILTKSGQIWLVSDKDNVLARNTQLGGYGTGQYVKTSDEGDGTTYTFPLKDKTIEQLDETSFRERVAANTVSTMTFYKLLVMTERECPT